MRHCDLPDSPLASHRPDITAGIDQLPDFLHEKITQYQGKTPANLVEMAQIFFGLIAAAMKEANCQEVDRHLREPGTKNQEQGTSDIIIKLLQLMSRDTDQHYRMRALCYLRLMGLEGRSFRALGDELGVVRATVHKCYRDLQKRLGDLPGRGDKSPEARETYRRARLGQRRERGLCHFASAWLGSACLTLLPAPTPPLALRGRNTQLAILNCA
jgi:hypothetical protein